MTTKMRSLFVLLLAGVTVSSWSSAAHADEPARTSEPAPEPVPAPSAAPLAPPAQPEPVPPAPAPAQPSLTAPKVTFSGYVEAYYSYNLNQPANGLANYRWLDDRHNTFQLSTLVVDALVDAGDFNAHVAMQAGPTADGWYAESGEARPGAAGAAAAGAVTWHHIQQANVGWKAPVGSGLLLQAGLFLTPIGYEVPAVKDNFNWSRSNLFFVLPFYHAGVRASYDLSDRWNASAWLVNGWNSASDSNDGKSVIGQVTYKVPHAISASVLYMGGPERRAGSPEGPAWRHLFDAFAQVELDPRLSLAAHVDGGFEQNRFGTHSWRAAALYARVQPLPFLYLAARGDAFVEDVSANAQGKASSMFFGTDVYGLTGTIDVRPIADHLSIRAEYRHDVAAAPLYFANSVTMDPTTKMDAPNARTQDTLTLGVTGWF
jgi:hypothetical protein